MENDSKSTLTFPLERDTVFSVYANLSCIRDPGSDITVEFRTAAELVDAYNEEKQTSYAAMPEACYTIDDTRAVIPNGKYISSPVTIRLNSAAFDGVGTFLLPITIERVTPDLPVSPDARHGLPAYQRHLHDQSVPLHRPERLERGSLLDRGTRSTDRIRRQRQSLLGDRRRPLHLLGNAVAQRETGPAPLDHDRHGQKRGAARDSRSAAVRIRSRPTRPRPAATRASSTWT